MASSPSLWELPVAVAADGVAVPVLHPPRCSFCQFTGSNHPSFKGVYNCLCEVNSDLEVLATDSKFTECRFFAKMVLRKAGFPTGESVLGVMACEISPQLSDNEVKRIRKTLLEMKVAAMISMKFDSNEILPDWCFRDVWWFGRIDASGDFSFEPERVSSTEVQKIDTPWFYYPQFHFRVLAQMLDDPERYESVVLEIPSEMFEKKLKAAELGISPMTFTFSKIVADYDPRLRTARARLFNSLGPVMSTKNLKAPKLVIDPGNRSFMENFGKRPVIVTGGGNAETPEVVITLYRRVISSFQFIAAQEHVIDIHEQMPETEKIIPVIRFSNEAIDPPAKLNEIVLGITGQAAFSIMGYALTGSSSSSPALYFVVGATAIGFICTLIALTLKRTKKPAARILGKVGGMATATAVIGAMGTVLPVKATWISGIACLLTGVAMAFA